MNKRSLRVWSHLNLVKGVELTDPRILYFWIGLGIREWIGEP